MKISHEIQQIGMQQKSKEFKEKGSAVYVPVS
jgi:hypothetical protein